MAVRPVYAPALVVFVGGPRWAGSFGGGGGVAWVPLAPGEGYVPAYHVSPGYVSRVNVVNVTNVTNITNVTNVHYANQNVPGAVTAISRADFANSRAVSRVGVNVSPHAVASAQVIGMTAPVSPRRESLMGHSADAVTSVPRPRESVLARPVVTRSVPPPAPVPFAARQQALAENPGRPLDNATLTNLRRQMPVGRPEAPVARPIEPAGRVQPYESPATAAPAPTGRPQPYEPPNARPQPVQRANPDRPPVVERAAPEARPQPVQRANPDRPPNAQRIEPEQRRTERVEPRTERQEIRRDERRPAPQERPRDEKAKPEKAKPERPKSSDR